MLTAGSGGYETAVMRPAEYGVDFCGGVPLTGSDLIRGDPGLVRKPVDATLAGWGCAPEFLNRRGL